MRQRERVSGFHRRVVLRCELSIWLRCLQSFSFSKDLFEQLSIHTSNTYPVMSMRPKWSAWKPSFWSRVTMFLSLWCSHLYGKKRQKTLNWSMKMWFENIHARSMHVIPQTNNYFYTIEWIFQPFYFNLKIYCVGKKSNQYYLTITSLRSLACIIIPTLVYIPNVHVESFKVPRWNIASAH